MIGEEALQCQTLPTKMLFFYLSFTWITWHLAAQNFMYDFNPYNSKPEHLQLSLNS